MKTILITGSSGFIGSNLIKSLNDYKKFNLILLKNKKNIKNNSNYIVESSLNNLNKNFWEKHNIKKIDIVIHLASFTPKDSSQNDLSYDMYFSNIDGTRRLLDSLPNIPEKIIFSSTLDVYCRSSYVISEDSNLSSNNFYSSSKLFSEYLIQQYCFENNSTPIILRLGHIYGPGENEYKKFIPTIIRNIINDEDIIIYGNGENKRDFLYIDDAIKAIIKSIFLENNKLYLINIVSGKSKSLNEYLSIIFNLLNYNKKPIYKDNSSKELSYHFNNKKMIDTFGDFNFCDIRDGVLNEINYIKKELNG